MSIVRKLDALGRVTLPMEMRKLLDFEDRQEVSITLLANEIRIKKPGNSCLICGNALKDDEVENKVCNWCINKLVSNRAKPNI